MAFEVVMPRLGWNMETGALAAWRKQDGDFVKEGEILFEVESEKAVQEVEALESGILRIPPDSPPPGQPVPVGTLLAYLVKPGEATPDTPSPAPESAPIAASAPASEKIAVPRPTSAGGKPPAISPRARRVASELGVDWLALKGSGRTGRIVERDVRQAAERALPPRVKVTPLAQRVAEETAVDLTQLAAQMSGKRIRRADVETAAAEKATARPTVTEAPADTVLPISQVRRVTAERMAFSAHTAAPVTLNTEADATELVRLRQQLKDGGMKVVPSYNDLLAKLVAQALVEHPQVNARFEGETIVQAASVNMGYAVDTERGLLVPVLRDVQAKSLRQIALESAALIERARNGRIGLDDLQGGTFTITNLGMFEIDTFTPIINLPECAVLGVGRIVPKQIVVDVAAERVAIRHMLTLSLTFDHRLVDGAPAARFLQRVKQYVEKPYLWLVN
jgi:pyruvate dehydrogenase E2 component (dihydrolipoamide acetyltransferase)